MTTLSAYLTDRYELLEALSGSGLYAVYRARDKSGGGSYLIRVPRAHVLEDSGAVDRFRGVMANISQVAHPNALRVREVGGSDSDLWIVSEDSGDPTLKGLLPEGLELGRALDSIADVAEAVDAVHGAGALHGDIRPINVHLSDEGRTQLAGAGVSFLSEAVQSLIRSSMQTPLPSYMAPEILRGARPSVQSDVYALGMLLYEVATGTVPFPGNSNGTVRVKQERTAVRLASVINGDLPVAVDALIVKAMAWEPADRYSSAGEFAQDVRSIRAALGADESTLIVPHPEARNEIRLQQGLSTHTSQGEGFLEAAEAEGIKVCPTCLTLNTRHAESCSYCWRGLEAVPVLSTIEGEEFTANLRRRTRRRKLIRRGLLALGVALIAVVLIAERNVPPGILSGSPTTTLTAAAGEGLWTTPRNGTVSTGAFTGSERLPAGSLAWSQELGDNTFAPLTIADGKIFVATRDRRVLALDQSTGQTIWELPMQTPLDVSPVIADDLVFIMSRNSTVTAVESDTGDMVWSANIGAPSFSWVAIDEGNLFVVTNNGLISGLDAATGVTRWRLATGLRVQGAPAVTEDRLVVATLSRRVFFMDAFNGAMNLVYLTRSAVEGTPAMSGDIAYIAGNDRFVRAVRVHANNKPMEKTVLKWWAQFWVWGMAPFPPAQSGTVWSHLVGERMNTSPALAGEIVVVTTQNGTVFGLNTSDGTERWRFSIDDEEPAPTSPIIVNDVAYVGTKSGRIHALSTATGERLWTFTADGAIAGNPAFANGLLYFVTVNGTVYALE